MSAEPPPSEAGPILPIPFCIFAKPPRPGRAKTRLAAGIGAEAACRLATCFLSDTLRLALGEARLLPVLATTDDGMPEGAFPGDAFPEGVAPGSVTRWLQPEGDLGARIEGIVRQGLESAPAVICAGADSPGRPPSRVREVLAALDAGAEAVLGPAEDGGYDLLALRRCEPGLLAGLPWSQPDTFEATLSRLRERGLRVDVLSTWWDVDEPEDLARLAALLRGSAGRERAPATAAALEGLGRPAPAEGPETVAAPPEGAASPQAER